MVKKFSWGDAALDTARIILDATDIAGGIKLATTDIPFCFVAGTLVETEDGQKPIEEVEVGDKVWAYDTETGKTELKEVQIVYVHDCDEILHLHTSCGDIDTISNHPFYVIGKGWVTAGELKAEDEVYRLDGSTAVVTGSELERLAEPVKVYNLEVDDYHTYFVGDVPILVHNYKKSNNITGGAYGNVGANGGEVHHIPAKDCYRIKGMKQHVISDDAGPSIRMDKADHMKTASWGRSKAAQEYREKQQYLVSEGLFKEAQQMDIDDIRLKFGNKYDTSIQEMKDYTNTLFPQEIW